MNNDNQLPIIPITCPICGNTKLAYVTEYHKCIYARIINSLLLPITIILALLGTIKMLTFDYSKLDSLTLQIIYQRNLISDSGAFIYFLFAGFALLIFIILQITISTAESKTHVCAICNNCGKIWNLN